VPPGKTAMLDFYADWCVSCKEMEKLTFSEARVQADVTANDEHDKAMLRHFGLFDAACAEYAHSRVISYQYTDKFLQSLAATLGH
jgi:thiol:disulfide interchange protein DsbD